MAIAVTLRSGAIVAGIKPRLDALLDTDVAFILDTDGAPIFEAG